jgi:AcrR family transcriptional regulator
MARTPAIEGKPRWRRRAAARPDEIVNAALEVFAEDGLARARLDEVARRAGVTKGTIYLYFDSKEALFRAVVRAKVGGAVAAGEQFVETFCGSAVELLGAFIRRYWASLRESTNDRLIRLAFTELGNFPDLLHFYMDEVVDRARQLIVAILKRGMATGEFRAVDPDFAAGALQALCVHLAQAQRHRYAGDGRPLADDRIVAGIFDLYLTGMAAPRDAVRAKSRRGARH